MPDYEVCVIGGGPAGFAAAMRCWDFGKRIALVEKGPLGGAGVFNGALSSKCFWELSRDYRNARRLDRGYRSEHVEVDFDHVRAVVDPKTEKFKHTLEEKGKIKPEAK